MKKIRKTSVPMSCSWSTWSMNAHRSTFRFNSDSQSWSMSNCRATLWSMSRAMSRFKFIYWSWNRWK
jgi:hypothetical protein